MVSEHVRTVLTDGGQESPQDAGGSESRSVLIITVILRLRLTH